MWRGIKKEEKETSLRKKKEYNKKVKLRVDIAEK